MRRSPAPRVAALVAILAALATASAPLAARSGRDRDRAVRTSRAGIQRLDCTDGSPHGHDEDHDGVLAAADATRANGIAPPGPESPATLTACPDARLQVPSAEAPRRHTPHPARQPAADAHAPDRAPPTA